MEKYLSPKKSSMQMRSAVALPKTLNLRTKAAATIKRAVNSMQPREIAKRRKNKARGRFKAG